MKLVSLSIRRSDVSDSMLIGIAHDKMDSLSISDNKHVDAKVTDKIQAKHPDCEAVFTEYEKRE